MKIYYKKLLIQCLALGISGLAYAEEKKQTDDWMLLVSPFVWGASLKGDVAIAGQKSHVDLPFKETLSSLDSIFMGNLELSNRRYGFYLDAVHVDTSETKSLLRQKIKTKVQQSTLAAGGFYRAYQAPLGGDTIFGEPRHFTLDPIFGVRWTKIKTSLSDTQLNLSIAKETEWIDPFIGVRASADLSEHWNLSALTDIGGFDTANKKTYNGQVYLGYRTFLANQPTLLRVGYRYLSQRYKTRDFTGHTFNYDIRQSGPVVGLTVRF